MVIPALIESDNQWFFNNAAASGEFKLPDSVSSIMTSKIDRLSPSQKMLVMVASVIGMAFPKHVLFAVFPVEYQGASFQADLDYLIAVRIISRDGGDNNIALPHFKFEQTLLHKTAYELLIFKKRRDLHFKIAEYYENTNRDYLVSVYTILAYHYYLAESWEMAVKYLLLSGKTALLNNELQQVVSCYSKLLTISEDYLKGISDIEKTSWRRKLSFAVFQQGNLTQCFEYLREAMTLLGDPIPGSWWEKLMSKWKWRGKLKNDSVIPDISEAEREKLLEQARCYEIADLLADTESDRFSARLRSLVLSANAAKYSSELARSQARMVLSYARFKNVKKASELCIKSLETLGNIEDHQKTNIVVKKDLSVFNVGFGQWSVSEKLLAEAQWVCEFIRIK